MNKEVGYLSCFEALVCKSIVCECSGVFHWQENILVVSPEVWDLFHFQVTEFLDLYVVTGNSSN